MRKAALIQHEITRRNNKLMAMGYNPYALMMQRDGSVELQEVNIGLKKNPVSSTTVFTHQKQKSRKRSMRNSAKPRRKKSTSVRVRVNRRH